MLIAVDHLPFLGFLLVEILVALALGAYLFVKFQDRLPSERLTLLFCPAVIVVCLTIAANDINQTTLNPWSGARMFPAIALLYGAEMYVGPNGPGAMMNTIYPPLSYLAYMPAALFSTPTPAILLSSSISLLLYLAPAFLLTFRRSIDGNGNSTFFMGVVCMLMFFQATMMSKAMIHVAYQIHADTPMFAFVGFACLVIYRNRGEATLSNSAIFLSSLFAVMGLWSKQTAITMVATLPLWVILNFGIRASVKYVVSLSALMMAFLLVFAGLIGLKPLMFNLFAIPAKHPWIYSGRDFVPGLMMLSADYFCYLATIFASILLTLFAQRYLTPEKESGTESNKLRLWLTKNSWLLFVLVAFAAIPTGMLSRIKVGGFWCNFAPTPYFLELGLIALLQEWYLANRQRNLHVFNANLVFLLLILVMAPFARGFETFAVINSVRPPLLNLHEEAYRYSLRHPGMAYFPWHPLSGLLAEGKAYHFEYGMSDRELGGFHVSPDHFRQNIPANFRYVCFPLDAAPEFRTTLNYLPDFKRRVAIEELPGFMCYER